MGEKEEPVGYTAQLARDHVELLQIFEYWQDLTADSSEGGLKEELEAYFTKRFDRFYAETGGRSPISRRMWEEHGFHKPEEQQEEPET